MRDILGRRATAHRDDVQWVCCKHAVVIPHMPELFFLHMLFSIMFGLCVECGGRWRELIHEENERRIHRSVAWLSQMLLYVCVFSTNRFQASNFILRRP